MGGGVSAAGAAEREDGHGSGLTSYGVGYARGWVRGLWALRS